jgi:hypothetical protein
VSGQTLRFDAPIHHPGTPTVTTTHLNTPAKHPRPRCVRGGFSVKTVYANKIASVKDPKGKQPSSLEQRRRRKVASLVYGQ